VCGAGGREVFGEEGEIAELVVGEVAGAGLGVEEVSASRTAGKAAWNRESFPERIEGFLVAERGR
jgi:hypothetical protein